MMNEETKVLQRNAEKGKFLYNTGKINRDEAKEQVMPYIEAFNKKSVEIAKKYGMRPKTISFLTFVR